MCAALQQHFDTCIAAGTLLALDGEGVRRIETLELFGSNHCCGSSKHYRSSTNIWAIQEAEKQEYERPVHVGRPWTVSSNSVYALVLESGVRIVASGQSAVLAIRSRDLQWQSLETLSQCRIHHSPIVVCERRDMHGRGDAPFQGGFLSVSWARALGIMARHGTLLGTHSILVTFCNEAARAHFVALLHQGEKHADQKNQKKQQWYWQREDNGTWPQPFQCEVAGALVKLATPLFVPNVTVPEVLFQASAAEKLAFLAEIMQEPQCQAGMYVALRTESKTLARDISALLRSFSTAMVRLIDSGRGAQECCVLVAGPIVHHLWPQWQNLSLYFPSERVLAPREAFTPESAEKAKHSAWTVAHASMVRRQWPTWAYRNALVAIGIETPPNEYVEFMQRCSKIVAATPLYRITSRHPSAVPQLDQKEQQRIVLECGPVWWLGSRNSRSSVCEE